MLLGFALVTGASQAQIQGQLGILTEETLAGNNPATGAPWAAGDQYRFVFHTSVGTTANSSDIEFYNSWVQELANASTAYDIGADDGVTWKVIGSTNDIDARDNTSTNPLEDGTGHAIFLLDGSTLVASDFEDLWDGEIQHIINLTEKGTEWAFWPFTGSYWDGTAAAGKASSFATLGGGGQIHQGQAGVTTNWVWRQWTGDPPGTVLPMYAMSEPLTIIDPSPFELVVTPNDANYDFSWDSKDGKLYDLVTSTSLGTDPLTWPAYDDGTTVHENIEASGTGKNTLAGIPGTGPQRFFVVVEKDIPPLLFADFEADDGGFTVVTTDGSAWVRGTPASSGLGGEVSEGAAGSATCWGTDIGNPGLFADPTVTSLRSPVIDLTGVTAAALTFAEALDIEAADMAVVNIIDDTTDTLIAGPIYTADDSGEISAAAWRTANGGAPIASPAGALGQAVRIEWLFQGLGGAANDYMGWYVDDVTVTGN
jgi:hypothetical protein